MSVAVQTSQEYLEALKKGMEPLVIVQRLAAKHGVTRVAIWKRLHTGGALPPYQKRQDGQLADYRARRAASLAEKALGEAEKLARQQEERRVCFMCGTRSDLGCRHMRRAA